MYHFIYKTTSQSGFYYYGRHSTYSLDDGYLGSGKWVRSIKNKSSLTREIVLFCQTFDELILMESDYIQNHINDPNCMNFNENPIGFSSINNPNKLLKGSKILSDRTKGEKNGMYGKKHTEEVKQHLRKMYSGENGNFYGRKHTEEAKEKIRQKQIGRKFSPEVIEKLKMRFPGTSHPMSKLTEEQIIEIYNLAWGGNLTQKQIAEMFDVRQGHVTKIKNGKLWGNITKHNTVL